MTFDHDQPAAATRALMTERLGVQGRDLETQLAKAGRRLPRRIRREAAHLAQAERFAAHPKMARRIDPARTELAARRVTEHLEAIDPKEERKTRLINLAALIAAQVLIVLIGLVAILWWRGLV